MKDGENSHVSLHQDYEGRRSMWFPSISSLSLSKIKYVFIPVEIAVFLYMYSAYFHSEIYQQYFYQQSAHNVLNLSSNFSGCLNQSDIVEMSSNETFAVIQDETNHLALVTSIVSLVPSILVVIVIGGFIDKFGRKPVMLFIFTGHIVQAVVGILVTYFNLNMYLLLIGGFASAITGGFGAVLVAAYAYIADITPKRWLTIRMGFLQLFLFGGAAASSASSDSWLGSNGCDFHPTMWLMIALAVLSLFYILILPESLTDERRNELLIKPKRGIKAWIVGLKIYLLPTFLTVRKYWKLLSATAVISLAVLNETGAQQIMTYFLQNKPLEWSLQRISLYNTIITVTHCVTLLLVLPIMVILRFPDPLISLIGVLVASGMITIYGFAKHSWPFWIICIGKKKLDVMVTCILHILGGSLRSMEAIVIPALRSLISKLVPPDDQGELQLVMFSIII